MKVFFDVTCLMPEKLSGIGVYSKHLFTALARQGIDCHPVIKSSRMFKKNFVDQHIGLPSKVFWDLPRFSKQTPVLHGPDFRLLSSSSSLKKIVTIHDIAVFHQGFNDEHFRQRGQNLIRTLIKKQKPDGIIVPSQTVASELIELFPETAGRVHCVYHGADHMLLDQEGASDQSLMDSGIDDSPYFLFIGHLEKRKNLSGVIEAFEQHCEGNKDTRLLVIGKPGFGGEDLLKKMKESKVSHRIHYQGYVSSAKLAYYYKNALAFVFPSFYEGFGFPILEAMQQQCPVIASDRGTMAEIAGDAAVLVNPDRIESVADAMEQVFVNSELREQLVKKGLEQAKTFTWAQTAKATAAVYRQ